MVDLDGDGVTDEIVPARDRRGLLEEHLFGSSPAAEALVAFTDDEAAGFGARRMDELVIFRTQDASLDALRVARGRSCGLMVAWLNES